MHDIICARSEDALPWLEDDSVDLVVTDPPYGWEFMGKDWDKAVPPVAVWEECLRVLKPGAFAFVMCGPRMDCLSEMGKRLAEAGFEIGFSPIYWAYASGFPKAANIGKLVDKRLGAEREVVGSDSCFGSQDSGIYGFNTTGLDKTKFDIKPIPATPEAQALDGSYAGFQPKPAVEVVIVAMKPLSHGTYIDQALDNGHGVTWLDDARIPHGEPCKMMKAQTDKDVMTGGGKYGQAGRHTDVLELKPSGRLPANLLCSDDCLNDGRVTKSTGGAGEKSYGALGDSVYGKYDKAHGAHAGGLGDSGSFSRYFSLDAWAIANLPESVQRTFPFLIVPKAPGSEKWFLCRVCDDVEHSSQKKAHAEHNTHCHTCGVEFNREEQKAQHKGHKTETNLLMHPTQKPVKLFAYLITLGSRPGDLVADFFGGVGTMPVSAKPLGRDYLMVEQEEQWCRIGQRRTEAVRAQLC